VTGGFHAQIQPLQHLHQPFCARRPIDNGLVIPAGETITPAPGGHPRSIEEVYFGCVANMSSRLMALGGSLRSAGGCHRAKSPYRIDDRLKVVLAADGLRS
jgi:hypothetical protein